MSAVSAEFAEEMLSEMESAFEVELEPEIREGLAKKITAGRVDFNPDTMTFNYRLVKPLKLENGNTVDEVTIQEPTADDVQRATKKAGEMDTIRILAAMTGQPYGVISRVGVRDMNAIGAFMSFFG